MENEKKRDYFFKHAPIVFGRYWKTCAAHHFGKSLNTILNWRKGHTPVPHTVIMHMQRYVDEGLVYNRDKNLMQRRKGGKTNVA